MKQIGWRVNQVGNAMQNEELQFDALVGEFAVNPEAFLEKHPYNLVVFHTKTHHWFNQKIMPLIRYSFSYSCFHSFSLLSLCCVYVLPTFPAILTSGEFIHVFRGRID